MCNMSEEITQPNKVSDGPWYAQNGVRKRRDNDLLKCGVFFKCCYKSNQELAAKVTRK